MKDHRLRAWTICRRAQGIAHSVQPQVLQRWVDAGQREILNIPIQLERDIIQWGLIRAMMENGSYAGAMAILQCIGSARVRAETLGEMAGMLTRRGDLDETATLMRAAIEHGIAIDGCLEEVVGCIVAGGRRQLAEDLLDTAAADAARDNDTGRLILRLVELAETCRRLSLSERAVGLLHRAMTVVSLWPRCDTESGRREVAEFLWLIAVRYGRLEKEDRTNEIIWCCRNLFSDDDEASSAAGVRSKKIPTRPRVKSDRARNEELPL